jgi:hypothetical protein
LVSIVVGDMHLGKRIPGLQPNPYDPTLDISSVISKWNSGTIRHIKENIVPIVQTSFYGKESIRWIFLGDIVDYPKNPAILEFELLLDYILEQDKNWFIDILVGNHDTSKIGDPSRTALSKFCNREGRVVVHLTTSVQEFPGVTVMYLPYLKRQLLLSTAYKFREQVSGDLPLVVFSHNNLYVSDSFLSTEMIPKQRLEAALNRKVILFNGHIHRTHYELDYYQVGSSVPTSFKETPQASGTCIFADNKLRILRNNKVMLLSIANPYHIDKLKWFLEQATEKGTVILLRIGGAVQNEVLELVKTYRTTVPGILLDSQKHT